MGFPRQLLRRTQNLAGLGLSACAWHGPRPVDHLYPADRAHIIAHRGAPGPGRENRLEAFRQSADLGHGFELDVTLSADGHAVVIHDDTLDRTTSGTGFVDQTPWSRLDELRIPALDEVLARFGQQVVIDIEIKSPRDKANRARLAQAVVSRIDAHGLARRVLVTSFDPFVLEQVRLANPEIARGQLLGTFEGADLSGIQKVVLKHLLLNRRSRPDVLAVESASLHEGYVRRMKKRGYRILAWTVNDPEEARRLVAWGVDGLITDRPDLAAQALGQGTAAG